MGSVSKISVSHFVGVLVPPDAAGVVLRARDDGVPLVVKRARKYLVGVALKLLQELPCFCLPQSSNLVVASCEYFGPLGVEHHLGDVLFMA